MCQPPTGQLATAVLKAIDEHHATIRGLRPVYSSTLQRVYEVVLSDGRTLELVMPPPSMLRLLRAERRVINSEAVVVQWLSKLLSEESPVDPGSTQNEEREDPSPSDRPAGQTSRSSDTGSQQRPVETGSTDDKAGLLRLLPKLVSHTLTSVELGAIFSIYQPRDGTLITNLPKPLTEQERAEVDLQLGRFTRQLARIESPTGRFGHAVSVLGSNKPAACAKDGSPTSVPFSGSPVEGSPTWSAAFHLMFEGILRDSEDMAITLAYPMIRKHFMRLSYLLDEVTVASLVFLDGMDDANVLVAVSEIEERERERERAEGQGSRRSSSDDDEEDDEEPDAAKDDRKKQSDTGEKTSPDTQRLPIPESPIRVLGLRDWSNGIFGDPLLATAFSNNPSNELLDGYYGSRTGTQSSSSDGHYQTPAEEFASSSTRLLLYRVYHATVSVVTEFYRPRKESTTRELAARRRLTEVLAKLEEVDDDPRGARHRRPSSEMSPAKKLKSEEKEWPSSSRRHETTE